MKKILSLLDSNKFLRTIIGLWLILQVAYIIFYWASPQSADGSVYIQLAQVCIDQNTWYPDIHNLYQPYLVAPGYINLLILVNKIFGEIHYIALVNLFLNIGLLYITYLLAKKIFSQRIANISVVLCCLTFSTFTAPIAALTDLPFIFLALFSLLCITKKNAYYLIIAGICIALSNSIRPLSVIFVFTSLVYMFTNKYKLSHYALYFLSIFLITFCIGYTVKERISKFMYASSTSGINLAMSASEKSHAMPRMNLIKEDEFYADLGAYFSMDFSYGRYKKAKAEATDDYIPLFSLDKDLKDRAVSWIKEHPFDYIKLLPIKLVYLYSFDNWTERSIRGKGFGDLVNNDNTSNTDKIIILLISALKSSVYYIIMLLFLLYLWQTKKAIFTKENIFLLIPFLGTAITIIFTVIDRYHAPFMPIITIYAAVALMRLLDCQKYKIEKKA